MVMRRITLFTFALVLPLLLCSCGRKQPAAEKTPENAAAETAKVETKTVKRMVSAPLPKAKRAGKDYQEGSLKVRISAEEQEASANQVQSSEDHSNVVILDKKKTSQDKEDAGAEKKTIKKSELHRRKLWTKPAPDSLAARLAKKNPDKIIRWNPKLLLDGTSGVRLPDAALSPDKSLIVFIETTGGTNGLRGSRIVAFDTHTWTIPLLYFLPKDLIRKTAFIGNTGKIALLCSGQSELENRDSLLIFDLQTGETVSSIPLPYPASRMTAEETSGMLYVTEVNSPDIRVYNPGNLTNPPKTFQSRGPNPVIAFTNRGKTIVTASGGMLEFHKTSDLRPLSNQKLPKDLTLEEMLIVDGNICLLVPSKLDRREGICVLNGNIRRFGENCAGILSDSFEPETFFALMSRKGEIVQFALPSLERKSSILPEDITPKKQGDPVKVFSIPHAKCLAVLDSNGNFYLLYRDINGRKWQKELLFSARRD